MPFTPITDPSAGQVIRATFGITVADNFDDHEGRIVVLETATVTGDVVGPAASVDKEIALFDATTGKLLERATGTGFVKVTSGVMQTPVATVALASEVSGDLPLANLAQAAAASRVMGRGSAAGAGDFQELTLGSNLSMTGTVLDAVAGVPADNSITYAKIQDVSAATRLLGRGTAAGSGDPQELSLGAGLSMAGTVLSSTVVGTGGGDFVGPASATNNGFVKYDGTTGKLGKDGAATIALASEVTGVLPVANGGRRVWQIVQSQISAVATGTTVLPFDDTIPQNTEGDEYMTLAITPSNASSILHIDMVLMAGPSAARWVSVALFQDSTADALAAIASHIPTATAAVSIPMSYAMTAGTTSATTFKVRAGVETAGTLTVNGQSGARRFGAIPKSSIKITEVLP